MTLARRARMTAMGLDTPLHIEDFEVPEPGRGKVLVEVEACGVCHRDLIDRAGRFPWLQLPLTPGHEAVGRVVAVGEGVTAWSVGDRVGTLHRDHCGACEACQRGDTSLCPAAMWVFGLIVDGGYATHLLAAENALYAVPDAPEAADLAALHCTAGTAWRGLVRAGGLQSGDRVVVTGANGGVGAAAIVVAKALGATVVAVVRDEAHGPWLEELGADKVVIDPGTSFHKKVGKPADVVLDCVGSPTLNSSLRCLRMGGTAVAIGNVSEVRAQVNVGYLIVNGIRVVGSSGATAEDMAEVLALHARAALPLAKLRDRVVPLEEAEAAQQAVQAGGLRGRIVLAPTA